MVTYFFFKNIAFGLTIFIYNLLTNASGQTVYNDWLMSSFNIFFTNFPVLALGILDQDDAPRASSSRCTRKRNRTRNSRLEGVWRGLPTVFMSRSSLSLVSSTACIAARLIPRRANPLDCGRSASTLYSAILFALNIQLRLMCNFWTWFHHVVIWGSLLLWFLLNIALSETEVYYSTYSYKTFLPIRRNI